MPLTHARSAPSNKPSGRVGLLLLLSLTLYGCAATRVNAPSVRPAATSPSGEWQEVLIEPKASSNIEQFRAPEVDVLGVKRLGVRGHTELVHRLPRRTVTTDTTELRYEFRGVESFNAQVSVLLVQVTDASNPLLGRRVTVDGKDGRTFHAWNVQATHRMQVGSDSSNIWELVSGLEFREATAVEGDTQEITLSLRNGERSFSVVPVNPRGPTSALGRQNDRRMWRATGWMVYEDGVPFGAVQLNGGTPLGQNDKRAWVPVGLSVAERQERLAVLIMLLMIDSQMPYARQL